MTTPARRRRGRAIRRRRIRPAHPQRSTVSVELQIDTRVFESALHDLIRIFERWSGASLSRPQILHNGKKP